MGKQYYPKLQSCVPFTPVPGNRLLLRPGPQQTAVRQALTEALKELTGVTMLGMLQKRNACLSLGVTDLHVLPKPACALLLRSRAATAELPLCEGRGSTPSGVPCHLLPAKGCTCQQQTDMTCPGCTCPSSLLKIVSIPAGNFGVSGLHLTFNDQEEWAEMSRQGFLQRTGLQYHWQNNGYETFEDFLADLKQPKRKAIRQVGPSLLSDEGFADLRRRCLHSGSRDLRAM